MEQTLGLRRAVCFVLFISALCFVSAAYSVEFLEQPGLSTTQSSQIGVASIESGR